MNMKIEVKRFAIAVGIWWGVALFVVTIVSLANGYAGEFLNIIASIYPGYSVSALGSVIGLVYGFVDGAGAVIILWWIYSLLHKEK